jgi:hypothetical protein
MAKEPVAQLLEIVLNSLDVPESYYQRAADRHRSLGEWLCRPESKVATFEPHITPQGSFRYGTVVRPLTADGEYDLDNVVTLNLSKTAMTQKQLKTLFGGEIHGYAEEHQMASPIEEMKRCWRLHYADEVSFHLDSLPCVGEEQRVIAAIMAHKVPYELAKRAVAITDKRHPRYEVISTDWLSSNPRGFARWFEDRTRIYALPQLHRLVGLRLYSSVEEIPAYKWKTPLQRSIQLLKRHRDVMFKETPELAPISMIITNLATHAYNGESDIFEAVTGILDRMPMYILPSRPRVPNPADPAEDYADKWSKDPRLEENFRSWHLQAKADFARLQTILRDDRLAISVRNLFKVDLTRDQLREFQPDLSANRAPAYVAPAVAMRSAPRPWGNR